MARHSHKPWFWASDESLSLTDSVKLKNCVLRDECVAGDFEDL